MSKPEYFGHTWHRFDEAKQDEIVLKLLTEENHSQLLDWLITQTGVDEQSAEALANVALPEGYGKLSLSAIKRILPMLKAEVMTYDKAVLAANFDHHSHLGIAATGEILDVLPYYGAVLERHVGFGSGNVDDSDEKRFGRIANPTVHIGLNQVRRVVNDLIMRYGHPSEVIVEVARELKQSKQKKDEETNQQKINQDRNKYMRREIALILKISEERVKKADIQKMILWEELSFDPADRCCPYSGVQISASMLFSDEVEIEHILPFSMTLDDSLNNKTVALRKANRVKGNRTPWDAFGASNNLGFDYESILLRAARMPKNKRYRFGQDGYQRWLRDDAGFLERCAPFVLCGANHNAMGMLLSIDGNFQQAKRFDAQIAASQPTIKRLWAEIVKSKLQQQAAALQAANAPSIPLSALVKKVKSGDPENIEAQGARRYWNLLFGDQFRRDQQSDGINAMLNYGYTVLRATTARAVVAAGLHPTIGLHHSNQGNAMRLVDDLMEPFRPMVDLKVWQLCRQGEVTVSPTSKRALVRTMYDDMQTMAGATPVMVCVQKLATSIAQIFIGEKEKLDLPLPGLPLDLASSLSED